MKVLSLRFLDPDDRIYFAGKWRKQLEPGDRRADDQIPGLDMTLNPQTGLISVDSPGHSTVLHVSRVAPKLDPAIAVPEPVASPPQPTPVIYAAPEQRLAKPVLDAEQGFDTSGDDIDDREVAKLLQGKGAKKALEKRAAKKKPGPKPKVKPAPEPVEDDDFGDEDGGDDE